MLIIGVAKGRGWHTVSQEVVTTDSPKRPFDRLLCETNHASLTSQCLTAPVMCTVPDPNPRPCHLHQVFQYDLAKGLPGGINPLDSTVTLYRVQYNVECSQTIDRIPATESMVS